MKKRRTASLVEILNLYSLELRTYYYHYLIVPKVDKDVFSDGGARASAIKLAKASA